MPPEFIPVSWYLSIHIRFYKECCLFQSLLFNLSASGLNSLLKKHEIKVSLLIFYITVYLVYIILNDRYCQGFCKKSTRWICLFRFFITIIFFKFGPYKKHLFLSASNIPIWTLAVETSNLFLSLFVKISVFLAYAIRKYFFVYSTLEI